MQKARREAVRATAEGRQQIRRQLRERTEADARAKYLAAQSVLLKPTPSVRKQVEDAVAANYAHALFDKIRMNIEAVPQRAVLLRRVAEKAPKLIDPELMQQLCFLAQCEWVRDVNTWKPTGKAKESVLRSLFEHLLCRFRTPKFLWSAFHDPALYPLVDHVAKGGSFYEKAKTILPLTRKSSHDFLQTTSEYSFIEGVRLAQIRELGGTYALFKSWSVSTVGRQINPLPAEEFWATVLRLFARNPMMDRAQIGPLIDYISYRRQLDPSFSMKGRVILALMRDMRAWHGELAQTKGFVFRTFQPSGYKGLKFEQRRRDGNGNFLEEIWEITEILNTKDLKEEGRVLHHCVYSYAYRIDQGTTSIWSMTVNYERRVTVEVTKGVIVQYRGRYNAAPSAQEFAFIKRWADDNHFTFGRTW